jgi:hypothetical protein
MSVEMFERMRYIPGFFDTYDHELSQVAAASERASDRIERETAKILRPDGSPRYAPQEHTEAVQKILDAAMAEFEQSAARYAAKVEQEEAALAKKLALLERDYFDTLKPDDQQRAALKREFVKEDVLRLPAHEVLKQAEAALASDDKVAMYLFKRYIDQRREGQRGQSLSDADLGLVAISRDLGAALGIEDRAQQRREIEAKQRAASSFPIAIETARGIANGVHARDLEHFRQHLAARF